MADISELTAMLSALKAARFSGATEITFGGRTVRYGTESEMTKKISALQAEIEALQGGRPVRNVVLRGLPHRGW